MTDPDNLRVRLTRSPIVVAPGVYDALTALLATQAGLRTLYVSGAAIAYTRLGRPDIGLVGMTEVAETVSLIPDRRCRYRLRQRAQRRAHDPCARACRRQCHPAGGSGFSQALRSPRWQDSDQRQ
jgi:isocitrate lyase